jgi:hypothetical protein
MKHLLRLFVAAISLISLSFSQPPQRRLDAIDFFGYKGLDVPSIRSGLPLREGDAFPGARSMDEWKQSIKDSVRHVTGHEPTDVRMVCCDDRQNWMIYIGLRGESNQPVAYNSAPEGADRLPLNIVKLYQEMMDASRDAVMKGKSKEDDSQGYALSEDSGQRAKQMALREYALHNEAKLLTVLASSSDPRHRQIAAAALGYARQSDRQIAAMAKACLDLDEGVRNDAVRALSVLARAKPVLARQIPASPFIHLMASGSWTDHNKAVFVLDALTKTRDTLLLAELRLKALDPLVEMARWRNPGHGYPARMIIGRIAGIEESRLSELEEKGKVDEIINALQPTP